MVVFPDPSAALQTVFAWSSAWERFLLYFHPKDSSLCSSALRALLVVHWEWCQLLRKKLISWSNYLFQDGLYPKLINHSIFGLFDLAWLQPEAAFWGAKGSTSPGSQCCGQDLFPRGCCKRKCQHQALEGFPIALTACCLQNDFAHMALGFVPLHIFIPAGVSAAPFINNAVGKSYSSGLSGEKKLWAWLQF